MAPTIARQAGRGIPPAPRRPPLRQPGRGRAARQRQGGRPKTRGRTDLGHTDLSRPPRPARRRGGRRSDHSEGRRK